MPSLELKIPPPIVAAMVATAMWGISHVGPTLAIDSQIRLVVALALVAVGITCDLLGLIAFRCSKTTINPMKPGKSSALVTTGIYNLTRNPMYLGMLALLTAWAVHLGAVWPFVGPVLFILYINRFQIGPEEKIMQSKFGSEFADYVARVRRWL
jgi:protein-S-isoprenylcysteine O-methyltransferase Ste14